MTKFRKFPPFGAIRAFEAAARHLSFREAAEEVCVTPSAISHQVKTLEDYLGTALFLREANHVVLTRAGQAYLADLTQILDQLDLSTRRAADAEDGRPLTILSTPGFATRWLAPNLGRCPGNDRITVETCDGEPSTDFTRNGADAVIAWGHCPERGGVWELLLESERYPVCSPDFMARNGLSRPADLLEVTLLDVEGYQYWQKWFTIAGLPDPELPRGPKFPHCEMALTAAEEGQGVAIAWDAMARRGLAAGRLVRPLDIALPPVAAYSVVCAETRRRDPRIRAFRDWVFEVIATEGLIDRPVPIRTAS